MTIQQKIGGVCGAEVAHVRRLHGGSVGEVYLAALADGRNVVAKIDRSVNAVLETEAFMLGYLARESELPVPAVYYSEPSLLIMAHVVGESRFSPAAEQHAAELLASLHNLTAPQFGFEQDTLIGGLHQPNRQNGSWLDFFREQRLFHRGRVALEADRLPTSTFQRLVKFCDHLDRWLEEPERPSLIHGDVWTTNVLAADDQVTGFIDPAIYYADPEIELAFTTLFDTFGERFFKHYSEIRPLKAGFFEERRHIYNLYPLLVHVQLFGGGYVSSVQQILGRFGC